jgi:tryptophanyl-tRNA synthetase
MDGLEARAEAKNLVGIYAALSGVSSEAVLKEFAGQGFGAFKPKLADLAVEKLGPIGAEMRRLLADPAEIDRILADGAARAREIAAPTMAEVRKIVGFWAG